MARFLEIHSTTNDATSIRAINLDLITDLKIIYSCQGDDSIAESVRIRFVGETDPIVLLGNDAVQFEEAYMGSPNRTNGTPAEV